MSEAIQRAIEGAMRNMAAAMEEQISRPLWVGVQPAVADFDPWFGPFSAAVNDLGEDDLGVQYEAVGDSYTFTCPGWESEPVTLSARQVDELCSRLMKHRTRTLYP